MNILGALQKLKLVNTLLPLNHSLGFNELTQDRRHLLCISFPVFDLKVNEKTTCIAKVTHDTKFQDSKASTILLSRDLYTFLKNWNRLKVSAKKVDVHWFSPKVNLKGKSVQQNHLLEPDFKFVQYL